MNQRINMLKVARGQRGMALISALLLLLVVSLLAVGLSMDTSMDVRITAHQRFKTRAFAFAESGGAAAMDMVAENAFEAGWEDASGGVYPFDYPHLVGSGFLGAIEIFQSDKFYLDKNLNKNTVISMHDIVPPAVPVEADIKADIVTQYVSSKLAEGGAVQIAAGYSGMGKGTGGGGGHINYNIEPTGREAAQTISVLALNYRLVTK